MKSRHTIFVTLEVIFGLGFGILGGYIFTFFDEADITTSVFNTFVIVFISMTLGIMLVGYFHFKAFDKLNEFAKAIGLSLLGLLIFIVLYAIVNALAFELLPHYISSVILPLIMPVIGGVIGLNYIFIRERSKSSVGDNYNND